MGEDAKLACTVSSQAHVWNVPGYITDATLLGLFVSTTVSPFMLECEDILLNLDIISWLSFTVFSDSDEVTVTCDDGSMDPKTQTLTASVPDKTMMASCVCM